MNIETKNSAVERWVQMLVAACAAVFFIGAGNRTAEASAKKADVMAVLDLSGSMRSGGAGRYEALFAWLQAFTEAGDRIGVVAMGTGARLVAPLTERDEISFQALEEELRNREKFTDLAAGMEAAYYQLKTASSPDAKRIILLYSDARIDMPKGEWDLRNSVRYLLERLKPSLKADGVQVLAVVPDGLDADFQLLHELSFDTGGMYYRGLPPEAAAARARLVSVPDKEKKVRQQEPTIASSEEMPAETVSPVAPASAEDKPSAMSHGKEAAPPVVVERVIREGASSWMIALFVIFGILLSVMFVMLVFLFRGGRKNSYEEDEEDEDEDEEYEENKECDDELQRMLDSVHSLKQLTSRRRVSSEDVDESELPSDGVVSEDPGDPLSLSLVSPFLEFSDTDKEAVRDVVTDDIASAPAFGDDEKNGISELSISSMETLLGTAAAEKHRE